MTGAFVADSSIGVAWATDSQANQAAEELKKLCLSGAQVIVPTLFHLELANGLLMLYKRKLLTKQDWLMTRRDVSLIPVIVDHDASPLALTRVSDLADRYGLTVYDAAYLELADRHGIPLASRDTDLNKAAKKCGVNLVP